MPLPVLLTDDAARDLEAICGYISEHDSSSKARAVLGKIETVFKSLSESPNRGVYPKEFLSLGIREYRQVYLKPYRLIYRVVGEEVFVLLIADGRRDMQSLLERRLLSGD